MTQKKITLVAAVVMQREALLRSQGQIKGEFKQQIFWLAINLISCVKNVKTASWYGIISLIFNCRNSANFHGFIFTKITKKNNSK